MKDLSLLLAVLLLASTSTLQDFTFTDDFLNFGKTPYDQAVFSTSEGVHFRHQATAPWNDLLSFAYSLIVCNTNTIVTFSFLNIISWRSRSNSIFWLMTGNSETNPPPGLLFKTSGAI